MNKIKNFGLFFCKVVCVIGIITAIGWTVAEVTGARVRFGSAYLEDTLTGGVSIGSGRLYAWDSARISGVDIADGQVKVPNGIGFTDPNLIFIDDDGNDLRYIVGNTGLQYFMTGSREVMIIDSNKITLNRPIVYGTGFAGGYKELIGILNGENPPALTILNNTFGQVPVMAGEGGYYTMTFSGTPLTNGKTFVLMGTELEDIEAGLQISRANRTSTSVIQIATQIWTVSGVSYSGDLFSDTPIILRVYN